MGRWGLAQREGWDLGRCRKGVLCACSGGWQVWRLVETSAICIEKEELAGQEGGALTPRHLKCSPEWFGFGKTGTGKQRMGNENPVLQKTEA